MKSIFRLFFVLFLLMFYSTNSNAQQNEIKIYNPKADANRQITDALAKAQKEGKHVFLQIGGNWCAWCVMMHKFYTSDPKIDSTLNANYVVAMINYSKENKNLDVLERLEYPQRFGFPVIVILDASGKRLHTQNTVCLEKGRGYDQKKFINFLYNWSPAALNPDNYKK